jgi:hypothetical protein
MASLLVIEIVVESSVEDVNEEVAVSSPSTSVEYSSLVNVEETGPEGPPVELVGCN